MNITTTQSFYHHRTMNTQFLKILLEMIIVTVRAGSHTEMVLAQLYSQKQGVAVIIVEDHTGAAGNQRPLHGIVQFDAHGF